MDDHTIGQDESSGPTTVGEPWLSDSLTHLADTLSGTFELDRFLGALVALCNEAVPGVEAGVILADDQRQLRLEATSGGQSQELELLGLQSGQGPALEAYRLGRPVLNVSFASDTRWAAFVSAGRDAGYRTAHAFPMRLHADVIGAVSLLTKSDEPLAARQTDTVRALTDMATIGITHERRVRGARELASQLQRALDSRVLIEQAKGMLAERGGIEMQAAFALLRGYARNHNQLLVDVAERVIRWELDIKAAPLSRGGAMTPDRRQHLRDAGVARWRAANADALTQIERASAATSVSAELRVRVEHDRALRVIDRERTAIDRQLSALGRLSRQSDRFSGHPRLLIADGRPSERARLLDAVRRDLRLHIVADVADGADALGLSIVEQPDLVVLDESLPSISALEIARQLGLYSPDTRRVLLVPPRHPMLRRRPGNIEAIFSRETDETALVQLLAQVVGL